MKDGKTEKEVSSFIKLWNRIKQKRKEITDKNKRTKQINTEQENTKQAGRSFQKLSKSRSSKQA